MRTERQVFLAKRNQGFACAVEKGANPGKPIVPGDPRLIGAFPHRLRERLGREQLREPRDGRVDRDGVQRPYLLLQQRPGVVEARLVERNGSTPSRTRGSHPSSAFASS